MALYILFTFGLGWLIHEFRLHVMHVPTPKPETLIDPYREVWSRMRAFGRSRSLSPAFGTVGLVTGNVVAATTKPA